MDANGEVWIKAVVVSDETDCVRVNIKTYRQPKYGVDLFVLKEYIVIPPPPAQEVK